METLFIENYNVDIYEVWHGKQKLYQVNITEFTGEEVTSKPTGREQHVYVDGRLADIVDFCNKKDNIEKLFYYPTNSILKLVKEWNVIKK